MYILQRPKWSHGKRRGVQTFDVHSLILRGCLPGGYRGTERFFLPSWINLVCISMNTAMYPIIIVDFLLVLFWWNFSSVVHWFKHLYE